MASSKVKLVRMQYYMTSNIRRLVMAGKFVEHFDFKSENDEVILQEYVRLFEEVTSNLQDSYMKCSIINDELKKLYRISQHKKYGVVERTPPVENKDETFDKDTAS